MFYYGKKIFYLSLYYREEKVGQVGFARINAGKGEVCITLQVKSLSGQDRRNRFSGSYPLYLAAGTKVPLGSFGLAEGNGSFVRRFVLKQDKIAIGNHSLSIEEITGIWAELGESGEWQFRGGDTGIDEKNMRESAVWETPEKQEELPGKEKHKMQDRRETEKGVPGGQMAQNMPEVETAELQLEETAFIFQEVFSGNKWEELLKHFKQIHPFGDERKFICIEPKDFIVLQEKYQKLVNNSFLLHGFYNYRHLILGEDNQLGEQGKTCFYLGVPGVFYEREKMVAVMFGFEGFESEGAVEIGKFGYYMRRVEL